MTPTTMNFATGAAGVQRPPVPRHIACSNCDAYLAITETARSVFHCPQCHSVVLRRMTGRFDAALALYLASCVSFVVANCFPVLRISAQGLDAQATLTGAVRALYDQDMGLVALVVGLTTLVVPVTELICSVLLLLTLHSDPSHVQMARFVRWRQRLRPWNMVEILMLGVLVAIVKLGSLATVILDVGLWALAAFMLTHAAAAHAFESKDIWDEMGERPG